VRGKSLQVAPGVAPASLGKDAGHHGHAALLDLEPVRMVDREGQPQDAVDVAGVLDAAERSLDPATERLDRLAELLRGLERGLQAPQGLDAPTAVDDHGRRPRQRRQLLGQPKQTLALGRQIAALDGVQVAPDAEQPLDVGFRRLLRQAGLAGVDGPIETGDPVAALDPPHHGLVPRQSEGKPAGGRSIGDDRHQQGLCLGAVRPALQEIDGARRIRRESSSPGSAAFRVLIEGGHWRRPRAVPLRSPFRPPVTRLHALPEPALDLLLDPPDRAGAEMHPSREQTRMFQPIDVG
jgi:hypothetical protein